MAGSLPPPAPIAAPYQLTAAIRGKILAAPRHQFEAFSQPISRHLSIHMLPIKGGFFKRGSLQQQDTMPVKRCHVEDFWMAEAEISQEIYTFFLARAKRELPPEDLLSAPSARYFGASEDRQLLDRKKHPAVNMTHYAASKFCEWLSERTGCYYRLPTEAEWEYAARAGSEGKWFFGENPQQLGDFAWYRENAQSSTQIIRSKKPNPWGLYDMYGNVAEWVIDAYNPQGYAALEGKDYALAQHRYPRVLRGGSWKDSAQQVNSVIRGFSSKDFKKRDPQIPKSHWHHTDAEHVGFRIVSPKKIPSLREMHDLWNNDTTSNDGEDL